MHTINLVLLILGALSFALAVVNFAERQGMIALGLLAWILVPLIATAQAH